MALTPEHMQQMPISAEARLRNQAFFHAGMEIMQLLRERFGDDTGTIHVTPEQQTAFRTELAGIER